MPSGIKYGAWTDAHWLQLIPGLKKFYFDGNGDVKTTVLDGLDAHVHRLVPKAPGQSNGSSRVSGAWKLTARKSYRLRQFIRLPTDFAAGIKQQSGKLGWGLSGGSSPSGGLPAPDGFSVRVAFRGDKTQPDTQASVKPMLYVYSADQKGTYGDEFDFAGGGSPALFKRGKWLEVEFEVVVNSAPGASDGRLRGWINGVLLLDLTKKRWFDKGTPQVDRLMLSTFHGGADPNWAPSKTNEVAFASLCVRE